MAIIFDGRKFADEKERELKKEVDKLHKKGVTPKLVSILVGDNPASILYTNLKRSAAERIGATLEIKKFPSKVRYSDLNLCIKELNEDFIVHGIMIQLPLPEGIRNQELRIRNSIAKEKDVDGLKENSGFVPATVKAILQIIKVAKTNLGHDFENVAVVGAEGMVGKPLVYLLKQLGYKVIGCDVNTKNLGEITVKADLLISATGVPDLIKGDMVKNGAIVIDVGSPKGDVNPATALRAAFITPVPGGVGPVTIVSLLENLLIATKERV